MIIQTSGLAGKRILLIDDDTALLNVIGRAFTIVGCAVYTAANGQTGLRQFYEHQPDLVILDLMMPVMDGCEICQRIRKLSDVPIIMLTGLGKDENVISGLNGGADDYLVKPVAMEILIAHAQAVLRRAALPPEVTPSFRYDDGYLAIDLSQHQVRLAGRPLQLSKTESKLLFYLYRHTDQVCPYQQILADLWGLHEPISVDVVHLNIWRLRRKLELDPRNPRYLLTERGIGYRFQKSSSLGSS
jgi:two-component system KDP operon response regulator KdpE